jgi:hypothetical protein
MRKNLIKGKETKKRRKLMKCRIFKIKIDKSHLSIEDKQHLSTLFKEAKWFYNYCLSFDNIEDADHTAIVIAVKTPNGLETRKLTTLSGTMKVAIKQKIFDSLVGLNRKKSKRLQSRQTQI